MFRVLLISALFLLGQCKLSENELKEYLKSSYENEANNLCTKGARASFAFATDINNATKEKASEEADLESAAWSKSVWNKYFQGVKPEDYKDPELQRMLKGLVILGTSILDADKIKTLTSTTNKLQAIYSTAKICPFKKQECDIKKEGLNLEPEITEIFEKSRDYDELKYAWKAWRDATGAKMKDLYKTYVNLNNEAARQNNFSDMGALWRHDFEDNDFIKHIDELWSQLEPLYTELLEYVGRRLKTVYTDKLDISDGLYPAHIFGNIWAQSWTNLEDLVTPFPNASKLGPSVDKKLKEGGYKVLDLMKIADEFYTSMGLPSNAVCFDESKGSMIVKPTDGREVLCHASAWDFCDGQDYRLKMCTVVNLEDFVTIHHEMGHINYYLLYKHLPHTFRSGANPGFHEAVGDTIALSVTTPKHFQKIGLLDNITLSQEGAINALMSNALEKIAFLPFGLLIDKWRWDVFSNVAPETEWNKHWWKLRNKYQKMKPPVERSENDFDPGAKYHVPGDSQYISYFVARILQFQFYKSLCIAAGQYDPNTKTPPLSECDFYGSHEAGQKLRDGLSLGASKHWSEVLKIMTGEDKLDARPMMEYFDPLYQFLKQENAKHKQSS